ncbi:MAG: choice-of-anchor Q domain-containing protein [Xanthomonadales bacterium]|nr:choice-of-anchor Q domain-containing protein [Xanthomonadales bacterium]
MRRIGLGWLLWLTGLGVASAVWEPVTEPVAKSGTPVPVTLNLAEATEQGSKQSADLPRIKAASLAALKLHQGRVRLANTDRLELEFTETLSDFALELDDPGGESVFELRWYFEQYLLGTQRFAPSGYSLPDTTPIKHGRMAIRSPVAFNRIELKEIHGRTQDDPEYITQVSFTADKGTLDPNVGALLCQIPLGIVYNAAFYTGLLAFDPVTITTANKIGYAANLALKFCPPALEQPQDLTARVPAGQCTEPLEVETMQYGYANSLGFSIQPEADWGELGQPDMFHHNTSLEITAAYNTASAPTAENLSLRLFTDLLVPGATDEIYEECRVDGTVATSQLNGEGPEYACPYVKNRTLEFPVGINTVRWRATVKVGILDLVSPAIPGVPASPKVPGLVTLLLRLIQNAGVIGLGANLGGVRFDNFQDRYQRVTVFDEVPPTVDPIPQDRTRITTNLVGDVIQVQIEADEPGGVSQRNYERILSQMYDVSDACDRPTTFSALYPSEALRSFWPVSTTAQDNTFNITWRARDPGPNLDDDPNETFATMQVEVVDIRPPAIVPPPDIVEITTGQVTELGQPLVFDFVDLDPAITNDAALPLGLGLHEVTWTATDASGNSASAVQIVNIKSSNSDPSAVAQTGAGGQDAISFEPTTIRLNGSDADSDPLTFYIEQYPQNGFFVAPLYPYFVEDYRLERETPGDAELLATCNDGNGPGDKRFELEFPVEPRFITVADDGTTFVVDRGSIKCSTIPSPSGSFQRQQRIAIFDDTGALLNSRDTAGSNYEDIIFDQANQLIYVTSVASSGASTIRIYDFDLDALPTYRLTNMRDRETGLCGNFGTNNFCEIREARSAVLDPNGVLYVMDQDARIYALEKGDLDNPNSTLTLFIDYLSDDVTGGASSFTPGALAMDSEGFIYASRNNRIYKYSPSTIGVDGKPYPGSLVGWMGRCDIDQAPGDAAVCDVANRRSIGYSCTDAICLIDDAITQEEKDFCGLTFSNLGNFGCRPGQFRGAGGIDIDPQDNLYVADVSNARIQRFTPEGFFAGEAESACDGSCFVLGDFGNPQDVSVNSDHFYIVDPATNLVHVSLLTPFTEVGPDYAELVYQSDNSFACPLSSDCIDRFDFSVSDGVRHPDTGLPIRSAPATVEVEVARNFRPPVATPGISAVVIEDVETPVFLDGSELDPLDTLTFNLITPPEHGTVMIVGDEARYLSDPNYVGEDSFAFAAFDSFEESAPESVSITVLNVNDPPVVSALDDVTVGVGFTYNLRHDFTDPDVGENHRLFINWGDGNSEFESPRDADGNTTGATLDQGDRGIGRITADHIYTAPGVRTLEVCIEDQIDVDMDGNKSTTPESLQDCVQATVDVLAAPDLMVTMTPSNDTVLPGQLFSYDVAVTNQTPDAGSGQSASDVQLDLALAGQFDETSISVNGAGCQRDRYSVSCDAGDLAVGASFSLEITAQVPLDVGLGEQLRTEASATLVEDDPSPANQAAVITPIVRPADYTVGAAGDALLDKPDINPGDGICASEDSVCTLRAALEEANATAGTQTIAVGSGSFNLNDDVLLVRDSVAILGNGPDNTLMIAAQGFADVFVVESGHTLRLEDVGLSGGVNVPSADFVARGVRFSNGRKDVSFGGGLQFGTSTFDIRDSTFDGNSALDGGGIMVLGDSTGTLVNVTATANSGSAFTFAGGTHTLQNLTIVGNNGGCCYVGDGGALNVFGTSTQVTLSNSILAGNRGFVRNGDSAPPNCTTQDGGTLISGGNNLFGDVTGCGISLLPSDQVTQDALLFPAADNGGGLPTIRPEVTSLVVDAIADGCPEADARGVTRDQDGNNDGQGQCDIGALELRNDILFGSGFE